MKNKKILYSIIAIIVIITGIFIFNSRKITYTKEFTYLPQYKNMRVEKCQPVKDNQFGNAVYKLEGVDYKKFINNYVKILKRDGWTVVKENKPEDIEVKKDKHIAKIHAVDSKDYVTILIWTK
ncbi:hypothetical protein [Clostridium haemolyticum]|uniref:Lipoprotein n=1 Tax=Clostridium haemolyticum NCTC 9693 TaxID=1443114 RepID=A0ABR4TEG8_CLOHA|nr:hypothetical protein [Clostridium haemolyticum]KEI16747.1 hypothetical protein Z960_08365 [Clostridium haemolyticum NCTC 9693]KGN04692.1 hypothetical protein Z961_01455 [Clostridium haemolyticum NCTC 8350]